MGKNKKNKNRNNSAENAEVQAIMQQTVADKPTATVAPIEAPAAAERTEKLASLDEEIATLRAQRMAALDKEIKDFRESQMKVVNETIATTIASNQQAMDEQKKAAAEYLKSLRAEAKVQIDAQRDEAKKLEEIVKARQAELDARQAQLKEQSDDQTKREKDIADREAAVAVRESGVAEKTAEAEASKIKSDKVREIYRKKIDASNDDAEKMAEARVAEREKTFSNDLNAARAECDRLREELTQSKSDYDALRLKFGDDPENVKAITAKYEATIAELRKRIGTVPAEEVIADRDRLSHENSGLNERNRKLQDELSRRRLEAGEIQQLRAECEKCRAEAELAKSISQINIDAKAVVEQELEKLKAIYQPAKGANVRYAQIEAPYVTAKRVPKCPMEQGDRISEDVWLKNIKTKSDEYGIVFNERILKAFHTALKTAEWSPLTILAGVSGTGKSELPRLYSHFGGIVFEPVPVQPNWDSQKYLLQLLQFPGDFIVRFLPWNLFLWAPFCVALQTQDSTPIFSKYLRTIALTTFALLWITPGGKVQDFLYLAAPLSMLCGMYYEAAVTRYAPRLRWLIGHAGGLFIFAVAMALLFFCILPENTLMMFSELEFPVAYRKTMLYQGAALTLGALLLVLAGHIAWGSPQKPLWYSLLMITLSFGVFFYMVMFPYRIQEQETRNMARELAGTLARDRNNTPDKALVYKFNISDLYGECSLMNADIRKIYNLDQLPYNEDTVYLLGTTFPQHPDREWTNLLPANRTYRNQRICLWKGVLRKDEQKVKP